MPRKWMYIAAGIVVVFLLILVVLPLAVNVNSYRPQIQSLLGSALNRKVSIGKIGFSILSGGVATQDVSISDDPAFSSGNFLTAQSIDVGVRLLPLIFSHKLEVTGVTLEKPAIDLVRSASGNWNVSTIGSSNATARPSASNSGSGGAESVSVRRLNIRDGTLSIVETAGSKALVYNRLNLEASDLSSTTPFSFQFSVRTPGSGSFELSGQAGPLNQKNLEQTPLAGALDARNLDLAATGLFNAASGIAGRLDLTGDVQNDGKQLHARGNVTAANLQLVPGGKPAAQPAKLDFDASYQLSPRNGTLNHCDVHIGKAVAHLSGTFNVAGASPSLQMHLNGDGMPLSDLQAILPAVNVTLPAGSSLAAGTMDMDLVVAGPANRLVITGPVSLADAKLAGYDLGSKMGALGAFAGVKKSPDTVIQTFSSDLRLAAAEGIRADNIDLVVEGIGTITGNGTVGADQSLNFKMAAQLSGGALGGITKIAAGGNQNGGIPFTIRGTTSDPQFLPDVGGAAAGVAGGVGNAAASGGKAAASGVQSLGGSVGGLFGKKK